MQIGSTRRRVVPKPPTKDRKETTAEDLGPDTNRTPPPAPPPPDGQAIGQSGTGDAVRPEYEWEERDNSKYFDAVRITPRGNGTEPAFLTVRPVSGAGPLEEPIRQLLARIESTDSLIRLVTPADRRLGHYQRLKGIAAMGLVGASPDPASASQLLDSFRAEDLTEDLKADRNKYIIENIKTMAGWGLAALIVGLLLWFDTFNIGSATMEPGLRGTLSEVVTEAFAETENEALQEAASGGALPEAVATELSESVAAALGDAPGGALAQTVQMASVLSFLAAMFFGVTGFAVGDIFTCLWAGQSVNPDRFRANRRYRFSGWMRLSFGVALWLSVLALLAVDWLILGIGGVTINEATEGKPLLGFVGGLVVALAFDQAGRAVGDRAKQSFQSDNNQ